MSEKKKNQGLTKTYYGKVIPGRGKISKDAEIILSVEYDEYQLEDAECAVDASSFLGRYVEVQGTLGLKGDEKVLSISSIRELPTTEEEIEDFSEYDYM